MKRSVVTVVLLLAVTLAAETLAAAQPARYLVATRRPAVDVRSAVLHQGTEPAQSRAVRDFSSVRGFAADLTDAEVAALRKSPDVRYVVPVVERHLLDATPSSPARVAPNDYRTSQTVPYGIDMIHARSVWPFTKGRGNVNVAIVDTGIDYLHPDLSANYYGGHNVIAQNDDPFDDNHHGTHVAGTIGALDNGIGVVGVAPEVRLWSVKVLDEHGNGLDEDVIAGVDWVIQQKEKIGGNWIMSLSIGSPVGSELEQEIFQRAADEGILIVAAAGNSSSTRLDFPAAYSSVLSVAAIDRNAIPATFTNSGASLSIAAPGVDVLSSFPVGSVDTADAQVAGNTYRGSVVAGSPLQDVTGAIVVSGLGYPQDFPPSVAGNIALIQRGEITFNEKVRNAKAAGASAVILYNNIKTDFSGWTLIRPQCEGAICVDDPDDTAFAWPLVIAVSDLDGAALAALPGAPATESYRHDDYSTLSGTSMATPHVSGTAALLWALAPQASANEVRNALLRGATDLGAPGYDTIFGFGELDALAAAKQIAPARFGLPAPPPPNPPDGRRRSQ